jgi:hypothetical protein
VVEEPGKDRLELLSDATGVTGVEITVGEKEVWELRAYPAVEEAY